MSDIPEPDRLEGAPHPRETRRFFGQEAAEAEFLGALASGRPPHGWLIAGARGTGKATLAWRIARHMLAGAPGGTLDMDPDHPVFRQAAALGAPQIFLARRPWDEKAKRLKTAITVDEIRALKAFFQLTAPEAGWRVAIVDAADELTTQAANALLKTLEEPPERAMILLVAHRPAGLLPTIRSRTRLLRTAPLGPDALAAALEGAGAPAPADREALAALAEGSVGEAIRLLGVDGPALYDELAAMLAAGPPIDRRRAIALAEAAAPRAAEARYDATVALAQRLLGRLAISGAGAPIAPISRAEAAALARHGARPDQALVWATLAPRLAARAAHARAVHLDPAQAILDMVLQIDAAAAGARGAAA